MTPWLRTLRSAGLLLVLAAGSAHAASYASYASATSLSYASHPPHASHSYASHLTSYAVEPVPAESRAGSRAGEGRERPGREAMPHDEEATANRPELDPGVPDVPAFPDGPDSPDSPDSPEATVDSEPSPNAAPPSSSEPVFPVLPLGSGLVLIGTGLGLVFLALRVRRG